MMNLAVICLLSLLGNLLNIAYVSGFSTIPTLSSPLFSAIHSKSSEARSRSLKLNTKRRQVDSIKLFRTHTSKLSLATPNDESDDREGDMDDNNTNNSNNNTNLQGDESSEIESLAVVQTENSLIPNIKDFLTHKAKFNRESLSKLGMSALLAYGFVSNVSGVIAVSCAWFIFCKRTGVSPMGPGQKPAFLAMYAGFTVMLNIIRPARFALSMTISPYFERIRKSIQRRFGVSPKGAAVLMIVFINMMGTCSLMALGVGLASLLSGVPVWATK